jgi:hypothetical protein
MGSLMQLVAYGAQDIYLTGNANIDTDYDNMAPKISKDLHSACVDGDLDLIKKLIKKYQIQKNVLNRCLYISVGSLNSSPNRAGFFIDIIKYLLSIGAYFVSYDYYVRSAVYSNPKVLKLFIQTITANFIPYRHEKSKYYMELANDLDFKNRYYFLDQVFNEEILSKIY